MGIARRKAGTVVRCPTCSGQVVVPNPEGAASEELPSPGSPAEELSPPPQESPPKEPPPPRPDLFERSSFGEEFLSDDEPVKGSTVGRHAGLKPVSPPVGAAPAPPKADVEPLPPRVERSFNGVPPPAAPPGILLSPAKVTILAVLVVLLIGVAFFAGMLVGRS